MARKLPQTAPARCGTTPGLGSPPCLDTVSLRGSPGSQAYRVKAKKPHTLPTTEKRTEFLFQPLGMASDENQTDLSMFSHMKHFTVYEAKDPHRMLVREGEVDPQILEQGFSHRLSFSAWASGYVGSSGIDHYFGEHLGGGYCRILESQDPVHRSVILPPMQEAGPLTGLDAWIADGWKISGGFAAKRGGSMLNGFAEAPTRGMLIPGGVSPVDGWTGECISFSAY